MNPRIKELADKVADIMPAGVYNLRYESGKRGVEFTEDALQKFAELIIRECISELEKIKRSGVPTPIQGGLNLGVVSLKEHFGVEE